MMVGDVCYVVFSRGHTKAGLMAADLECCVEGMNNSEPLRGLFHELGDRDTKRSGLHLNSLLIYEGLLHTSVNAFH